ncbi:MAG: site-specific integrase, partial [Gammaproteobacteria bacterium]
MGRKRSPGLVRRPIRKDGSRIEYVYHIDKVVHGQRICESCGTGDLEEAERYLARRMEQLRQVKVYGVRPSRTFQEAAIKYLRENLHKRSIGDDSGRLKAIMPYIGAIPLDRLHTGVLAEFITDRQHQGRTAGTINHALKVVRHILNLAATEWMDEHGLTWLPAAPKIKLLPDHNRRRPHPLSWDEQDRLFRELP